MIVNEESTVTFVIMPTDETGASVTPASARYRVDDLLTQNELIGWTNITDVSSEMTIQLPGGSAGPQAMIDAGMQKETKVLTVQTDFGTDDEHNEEFKYKVRNLHFAQT